MVDANANPSSSAGAAAMNGGVKKGVAFGMGLSSLLGVKARGHSVPNLGEKFKQNKRVQHTKLILITGTFTKIAKTELYAQQKHLTLCFASKNINFDSPINTH